MIDKYLITVGILLAGLVSCSQYREYRYEYINRNELIQMQKLYLLGVDIDPTPSLSNDNQVLFYSTLFINNELLSSFIEEFNQYSDEIQISLVPSDKIMELQEDLLNHGIQLGVFQGNLIPQGIRGKWIREMHPLLGGDGYVTLQIDTSVWKQNAKGFFKVYNSEGKVVWREEIKDFSTYIIFDRNSPYLIKNKQMKIKPLENSYYQELKRVYRVLGSVLAKEFIETL